MMRWVMVVLAIPLLLVGLVIYSARRDGKVSFTLVSTVATNGGYVVNAKIANGHKKAIHFMTSGTNFIMATAIEGTNGIYAFTNAPTRDGYLRTVQAGAELSVQTFIPANRRSIVMVEYDNPSKFKAKVRSALFWATSRGNMTYARSQHLSVLAEPPVPAKARE